MKNQEPSQFSTKPEALGFLKKGTEPFGVCWRQKGGADRGKLIMATLENGKVVTKIYERPKP